VGNIVGNPLPFLAIFFFSLRKSKKPGNIDESGLCGGEGGI
jgi:hypothetical protein